MLDIANVRIMLRTLRVLAPALPVNRVESPVVVLVGCPIPGVSPLLKFPEVLLRVPDAVMDTELSTTATAVSPGVSEISIPLIVVMAPGINVWPLGSSKPPPAVAGTKENPEGRTPAEIVVPPRTTSLGNAASDIVVVPAISAEVSREMVMVPITVTSPGLSSVASSLMLIAVPSKVTIDALGIRVTSSSGIVRVPPRTT